MLARLTGFARATQRSSLLLYRLADGVIRRTLPPVQYGGWFSEAEAAKAADRFQYDVSAAYTPGNDPPANDQRTRERESVPCHQFADARGATRLDDW
jgi:hypothetical protein